MIRLLAACAGLVFVMLAFWHFRMASRTFTGSAVPSVEGKPVLVPSAGATVEVGVVLLLFAVLVAATGGLVSLGLPARLLSWASFALSLGLLVRAVGEFRYVGFLKRVRDSRFARMDTLVYSPLCLVLAVGVAVVAEHNGFYCNSCPADTNSDSLR